MTRRVPPLSSEVRALLDRERELTPVPVLVRTRALARARAALVARSVARISFAAPPSRRIGWAAAAGLTLLATATVAGAYELGARLLVPLSSPSPSSRTEMGRRPSARVAPVSPMARDDVDGSLALPTADDDARLARGQGEARQTRAEGARAELRLLRQARAAVARDDFAAALPLIAEHARRYRYKEGRLAEEREALRVKALVGLGRGEEARRAAAAFERRFPRSVLLPAVQQMTSSAPSAR